MNESVTRRFKEYYNSKEDEGRENLLKSFLAQELLQNIPKYKQAAEKFAACCEIEGYTYGEEVYRENDLSKKHLFFVLIGACGLCMYDNLVAEIRERQCFGEFPILTTSVTYYTTPYSTSNETCIAKVAEGKFKEIAKEHPEIWKNIAQMLANRLKLSADERIKRRPNTKPNLPKIFIGCSTKGLDVARIIQEELYTGFEPVIWNQGPFRQLGKSLLQSLEDAVDQFDFGVFLFTPDDDIVSGGEAKKAPRDNVIFELGLFIGKLSSKRAYLVHPVNADIKILSDYNGILTAPYDSNRTVSSATLGPACNIIRHSINTIYQQNVCRQAILKTIANK